MQQAWEWLVCWLIWLANMGLFTVIAAFNLIMNVLATAANAAISLLPDSQLPEVNISETFIGQINYFLPLTEWLAIAGVCFAAWQLYRLYRQFFGWWA
jgi:hypothetical protein